MHIERVLCAPGRTGFFFDDQKAIKGGAAADGSAYRGDPVTPGFSAVRQAGESISILLLLSDGQIAHGDCAAVQYSGVGGRDPLFLAESYIPLIEKEIAPLLEGRPLEAFRPLAKAVEEHTVAGKPLHTAVRYGVSQALLDAVAKAQRRMMCEVVAKEYGTGVSRAMIPIFTQSGDNRYDNADKMILKRASVLPHGLINNLDAKLGRDGEKLRAYIQWLARRIEALRVEPEYRPVLHLDVYGTIGQLFGVHGYEAMADYLATLAEAAAPYRLRIEGPMDADGREAQMEALRELTALVDRRGIPVEIVADEWCNTLEDIQLFADSRAGHMVQIKTPDLGGIQNTAEAVLYCKQRGIGAYQGGTCNETDRSAQVCVHVAMATGPDQILAKPGMGVDEGYMIVFNEMNRILAVRSGRED